MLTQYLPSQTAHAFAQMGILTIDELRAYDGPPPIRVMPVTLSCIKRHVLNQTFSPLCTTSQHSWYGKVCHVQNSRGGMVRGIIRDLLINSHDIAFDVVYHRYTSKKRQAEPMELLMNHLLWTNIDFVSDNDCEDDENKEDYDEEPTLFGQFYVTATEQVIQLGKIHGLRLQRMISKVNSMYNRIEDLLQRNLIHH